MNSLFYTSIDHINREMRKKKLQPGSKSHAKLIAIRFALRNELLLVDNRLRTPNRTFLDATDR